MAVFLALWSRSVFIALTVAIIAGELILASFDPIDTLIKISARSANLLSEGWVLKTLAFALMVGSVMTLMERSGGVSGLVHELSVKRSLVKSRRSALMMSYIIGLLIFIESSITSLIAGAVGRAFAKQYRFTSAKLAFVCDSTSAPVCSIIALNGWGALLLGLIATQTAAGTISGENSAWLLSAIGFNFYAFVALMVTFAVIWFEIDIGPMRHSSAVSFLESEPQGESAKASLFIWPMVWMVLGVVGFMFLTGKGDLFQGSGSSSIFYTLLLTLLLMFGYYRYHDAMSSKAFLKGALDGAKSLIPITAILFLAFAIGGVISDLKVGEYLASFIGDYITPPYLAGAIFIVSSIIAFATGTSWGTFSIMLPIAIALASGLDAPVALAMGAVISGGVFGDHCSPISDTTIISSLASGCEVIEHVNTQLPYALIAGVIALILFICAGFLIIQ